MDSTHTAPATGTPRVLIVDDEEVIRELLADYLTSQGYEVVLADSGESGLAAFEARPFTVVLIDYGLPGMHGIDVCKKIASTGAHCRLVLMTGWGSMEIAERESCIDRVLPKPFDLVAILKTLQELAPLPQTQGGSR